MASDSTADPGAKRVSLEQLPPSKRSKHTDDGDLTMAWLSGEGPDLLGIIATFLNLGLDLTNMVVALAAGRRSEGKDIVRVVKRVYFRGNSYYLDRVFSSLPPGKVFSVNDERWEKVRRARDKLREWMGMNPNWEARVIVQGSEASSGMYTREVSVNDTHMIKNVNHGPYECRWRVMEEGPHLPGVQRGSVLLGDLNNIIGDKNRDEHVKLIFMKARDMLFNNPWLVVKLGLVEILNVMMRKRAVCAETLCQSSFRPVLWTSYFDSVDASCFTHLLSLEEVDFNQRCNGNTLLHFASIFHRLPLGIDVYRSLALHPATDVDAQRDHNGTTALHCLLHQCDMPTLDPLVTVNRIKVLLDAGANLLVRSNLNFTAMDYLATVQRQRVERRTRFGRRISEEQLDEIDTMMREALSRVTT